MWTVDEEQNSNSRAGPSSSTQQPAPTSGLRHPDLVITSPKHDSTGSSSTSWGVNIRYRLPYPSKFLAVVEITSDSTRRVDLYKKWTTYARSKVALYVILDRGTKTYPKCVIVGSLEKLSKGLERKAHGDPNPSRRRTPVPDEEAIYYRKIYNAEDKVDCPIFVKFDMTAAELFDVGRMQKLARELYHDRRANQRERAERAEKEAAKAKQEEKKLTPGAKNKREESTQKPQASEYTKARKNAAAGPSSKSPTHSPDKKRSRKLKHTES